MPGSSPSPHRWSAHELKAQLAQARLGDPFVAYRDEAGEQRLVPLVGEGPLTIGRGPGDLELATDAAVSWLHAEFESHGREWLLVDDGLSTNGTYLNGERIRGRARLRNGDLIAVGDTVLLFRAPAEREVEGTEASSRPDAGPPPALTDIQRQILIALCRPFSGEEAYATPATNPQIAEQVHLSVDRVKAQMRALFERFGVDQLPQNQKRLALARRAIELGAVSQGDLG